MCRSDGTFKVAIFDTVFKCMRTDRLINKWLYFVTSIWRKNYILYDSYSKILVLNWYNPKICILILKFKATAFPLPFQKLFVTNLYESGILKLYHRLACFMVPPNWSAGLRWILNCQFLYAVSINSIPCRFSRFQSRFIPNLWVTWAIRCIISHVKIVLTGPIIKELRPDGCQCLLTLLRFS